MQELLEQKALLEKNLDLINSLIEEIDGKTTPAIEAQKPAVQLAPLQAATAPAREKPPTPETSASQPDMPAYEGQMTLADTRRGCFLWTGILSALAIAAFALIYILYPG